MSTTTASLLARVEAQACASCHAMAAEVLVPTEDDTAVGMCWLCAHAIADHGASPQDALSTLKTCTCVAEAIYPVDVLDRRRRSTCGVETRPGTPDAAERAPGRSHVVQAPRRR